MSIGPNTSRRLTRRSILAALAGGAAGLVSGCGRPPNDAATLDMIFGKQGLMDGQFKKPRAIATDSQDRHFIVDMRAKIQVFDAEGNFLNAWRTPTRKLGRPSGLALDLDENLMVADSHYHRILTYSPDGELLHTIGGETGDSKLVGVFGYIGDVAMDHQGNRYVAESHQRERVTKLSPDGEILEQWGGRGPEPGQFQRARAMTFDEQHRLVIADACNHRLQIFGTDGRLQQIIGRPGSGLGELRYPFDVAVGPDRTLYVCEYENHRVQRFDPDGKSLGVWGRPGRGEGELWNPWALSVDSQGRVLVVDSNNHRIQRIIF